MVNRSGEVNSDIDQVRRHVEADNKLADQIASAAFDEAMKDPDGFVPVRLVQHNQRVNADARRAERDAIYVRLDAARRLGSVAKPGTITEGANN